MNEYGVMDLARYVALPNLNEGNKYNSANQLLPPAFSHQNLLYLYQLQTRSLL